MRGILLALTLWASASFAESPFLPISETNTFKSSERAAVEAAVAQAELEGKLVFVKMAAAWCGPCLALEKEMDQKAEELAPTLSHFVYVKLEEMHLEMMSGADFLAHEIAWFPSLYVYSPATKQWSFLYATDADTVKRMLDQIVDFGELTAPSVQNLEIALPGPAPVTLDLVMEAALPASTEKSGAEFLAILEPVHSALSATPERFAFTREEFEGEIAIAYLRAIERGELTFDQIRAFDPAAFPGVAEDAFLYNDIFFEAEIGRLIRKEGNKAASDQCAGLASTVEAAIAALPEEDVRTLTVVHALQCSLLKIQLGEASAPELDAFVATLSEEEVLKFSRSLAKNYAQTKVAFDKAIQYASNWKAAYEKGYAGHAELLARIQTATDQVLAAFAAGKTHP